MTFKMSKVGTRFACGRTIRKVAMDDDWGLITDVKLTRVSMFTWHLSFKVEVKDETK